VDLDPGEHVGDPLGGLHRRLDAVAAELAGRLSEKSTMSSSARNRDCFRRAGRIGADADLASRR
jgi:hypothetical protein